jgi:ATP-binding cassette, subfamily F, member 3
LVSHDWHLIELVADRLWLVADETARPFEGDLDGYEHHVLDAGAPGNSARSNGPESGSRRATRRLAAERRRELEPLRQRARQAEEAVARLTKEREALDCALSEPQPAGTDGIALSEALKRRAEIVRLIKRAEVDWLTAEEAIERESGP